MGDRILPDCSENGTGYDMAIAVGILAASGPRGIRGGPIWTRF
jgi:hypothetical protein